MTTPTNDWEFWLDENISPIIAKWMTEEINISCKSFHSMGLTNVDDIHIYNLAKARKNIIIISKDVDFAGIVSWLGIPPKLIAIKFGNCSNRIFWDRLKNKIYDAISELIYGDLDIFDIK